MDTVCLGEHNRLRNLFPISLVASIVLDLYVQIKRALRSIELFTLGVGALVLAFYIIGTAAVVLFAARGIALRLKPVHVLVVKVLDLKDLHKTVVSVVCDFVNLGEKRLIVEVDIPVLLEVVHALVELRQLGQSSDLVPLNSH